MPGGTLLDLGVLFDIDWRHFLILMYKVLLKCIINIDIGNINIDSYLSDIGSMIKVIKLLASF